MTRRTRVVALAAILAFVSGLLGLALVALGRDDEAAVAGALEGVLDGARGAAVPFQALTEVRVAVDEHCLLVAVADDDAERVAGLRSLTHLGPYDGMLFVFTKDVTSAFTMSETPLPLDVAWYDAAGRRVDRTSMEPCLEADAPCPRYESMRPYRYALETQAGGAAGATLGGCAT